MFTSIKQLGDKIHDLSDRVVTHGTTLLQLNLSENDSTLELKTIPLVETYKCLGVQISHNMTLDQHLSYIKPKIKFLTSSFLSICKASNSMKFCFNTWQLFVRPLLDYTATYAYFCNESKSADRLKTLYRTSLKEMLTLKYYCPNKSIDMLIQYDYHTLPEKFIEVARRKWRAKLGLRGSQNTKVNFQYKRIEIQFLPPSFPKVYNFLYLVEKNPVSKSKRCSRNSCQGKLRNRLHILEEHQGKSVQEPMYKFLDNLSESY